MKRIRVFASLLPVMIEGILILWGIKVLYSSFRFGTMPIAACKNLFGLTWVIAFFIVLLPAYRCTIGLGLEVFPWKHAGVHLYQASRWATAFGVVTLLGLLTFCTRIAVIAWFNKPMHPPPEYFRGGMLSGVITTSVLGLVVVLFHLNAKVF